LHLISLLLDPFISYNVANLIWPFGEPGQYRPLYVSLGVVGLYSLAVVTISSWVRRWFAYSVWRALHYVSAVSFVVLTLHGILAGTDTQTVWMIATYVTGSLLVGALLLLRIAQGWVRHKPALQHASRGGS
jgi:methionine sulfoxide reductase heme-binding subunit